MLALLAAPATADATFPGRNGDIAVGTSFGAGLDIGRIDLNGNRTQVTSSTRDDSSPAWSPDGSRIAFGRYLGGTNTDLFIANADGSNEVQLMNSSGMEESPRGRRMAARSCTSEALTVLATRAASAFS